MTRSQIAAILFAGSTLLSACGGGGVSSTPPPPLVNAPAPTPTPAPPPPPLTAITILPNPTPQEYAVQGVASPLVGYFEDQNLRLSSLSFEIADQPRIRYSEDGHYEIQIPGFDFEKLIADPYASTPTNEAQNLASDGPAFDRSSIFIFRSRDEGYSHSELATWHLWDEQLLHSSDGGYFAFGSPTPSSAVPTSGIATYRGNVRGIVDVAGYDVLAGAAYFEWVYGALALNVDFERSLLTGSMTLALDYGGGGLGTFAIAPSQIDSGRFASRFETAEAGINRFDGLFTGPGAEEAIGAWAVPFALGDERHQATGAWIAKKD